MEETKERKKKLTVKKMKKVRKDIDNQNTGMKMMEETKEREKKLIVKRIKQEGEKSCPSI